MKPLPHPLIGLLRELRIEKLRRKAAEAKIPAAKRRAAAAQAEVGRLYDQTERHAQRVESTEELIKLWVRRDNLHPDVLIRMMSDVEKEELPDDLE